MTEAGQTADRRLETSRKDSGLWPFGARAAILLAPFLLLLLLILWGLTRELLHFESAAAGWVLLGIAVLSLVPLLLVVLDSVTQSGGSLEVGKVKVALTAAASARSLVVLPRNVTQQSNIAGSSTQSLSDSGSMQILDALRRAKASRHVVINLEEGNAWWESRLLIVCAGAVRQGQPEVLVFIATREGRQDRYIGWGNPQELLDRLLQANPDYANCFEQARGLAEAVRLANAGQLVSPPGMPDIRQTKGFIVYPQGGNRLNPFLEEQLLADALGPHEQPPRELSVRRLEDLFEPVLHRAAVDRTDFKAEWFRKALRSDDDYVGVTDSGRYLALMTRNDVVSEVLLALTEG
jgi:hypothetical protein